jgi:hypothetical protein
MPLVRLNSADFSKLEMAWEAQCASYSESYVDFAESRIVHARKICAEDPPDANYGIFGLIEGSHFEAIVHINKASLPGTSGDTLRLVWILLAPRLDFEDIQLNEFTKVISDIIYGAIDVSNNAYKAKHIKIHLGNFADRQYFFGLASGLQRNADVIDVSVRGNWFHLSKS